MPVSNNSIRKTWSSIAPLSWRLGLALILLFGIPRFYLVLQSNVTGSFNLVSIIFVLMWFTPFILLTKAGRGAIGIKKPENYSWLIFSFLLGIGGCFLMHLIGNAFFGDTISNWFIYIAETYLKQTGDIPANEKMIYFIIFSVIGITFSPIGEEFLYRGIIHESFRVNFGERKASLIDSSAFGLTHLAHFGLVYNSGKWEWLVLPSILWVFLIFLTGLLFSFCKKKTGSILGAIVCHAGFNLAMTYLIFYRIM